MADTPTVADADPTLTPDWTTRVVAAADVLQEWMRAEVPDAAQAMFRTDFEVAAEVLLRSLAAEPAVIVRAVECDIDWTDLRSSRPGANVTTRRYRWVASQYAGSLAHEIDIAERIHRTPVRIRRRDVATYADNSKRTYPWVEVTA